jgi:hypothetical protein
MPLILLILAIVGVLIFLKGKQDQTTLDPNSPEGKLQAVYMDQKANAAISAYHETAGVGLTELQAAQLNKFKAIAAIAGTAVTVGVAGLSSLTLAAAGPVGAAVAAAIIAIGALRGTAHLVANIWTQSGGVQDQFGKALAAVNLEVQTSLQNGTATKSSLSYAIQTYNALWAQYFNLGEQFASVDKDHRTVIDNSYCDFKALNCRNGKVPLLSIGLVNALIRDVQTQQAKLKV